MVSGSTGARRQPMLTTAWVALSRLTTLILRSVGPAGAGGAASVAPPAPPRHVLRYFSASAFTWSSFTPP